MPVTIRAFLKTEPRPSPCPLGIASFKVRHLGLTGALLIVVSCECPTWISDGDVPDVSLSAEETRPDSQVNPRGVMRCLNLDKEMQRPQEKVCWVKRYGSGFPPKLLLTNRISKPKAWRASLLKAQIPLEAAS